MKIICKTWGVLVNLRVFPINGTRQCCSCDPQIRNKGFSYFQVNLEVISDVGLSFLLARVIETIF